VGSTQLFEFQNNKTILKFLGLPALPNPNVLGLAVMLYLFSLDLAPMSHPHTWV